MIVNLAKTCALRTCKCGERFATHDIDRRKCDGCYLNSAMYGTDGTADVDDEACGIEGGQGRDLANLKWSSTLLVWAMYAAGLLAFAVIMDLLVRSALR